MISSPPETQVYIGTILQYYKGAVPYEKSDNSHTSGFIAGVWYSVPVE